jgi:SAM-dependent methyltransferase
MSSSDDLFRCAIVAIVCLSCATGCTKRGSERVAEVPAQTTAISFDDSTTSRSALEHRPRGNACDSALPPIDCPLRKAGVNPQHLKPFADVQKYVAFLERPDRAAWQKPDEVVRSLRLTGDEVIADVGAGSGYFTFRFAVALPRGKVMATDIQPEMIRYIHHKAVTEGVHNVQPVLASVDDPKVPDTADLVFICDVLHHVSDRRAWLGRLHDEMKPGSRLVLIEFKEGDLPEGPPTTLKISRNDLLSLARNSGFALVDEEKDLLPYQMFLVFRLEEGPVTPYDKGDVDTQRTSSMRGGYGFCSHHLVVVAG